MSEAEDLLLLSRARDAWNAAKRDDDETMRDASELRLARAWPKPRVAPVRVFALGMATAFAIVALLAIVVPHREPERAVVTTAPVASAPPASSQPMRILMATPPARKVERVVATSTCRECKVEAGTAIDERVVVPTGSRLTVGFAFDDGLVDPSAGADLTGPAAATPGAGGTLTIERGVVRVRAPRDLVVLVPGGRVSAKDAVYTVRVDDRGAARIDVEKGRVAFVKADAPEVVVPAGSSETFEARGAPAGQPAPTAATSPSPASSAITASLLTSAADNVAPSATDQAKTLEEILAQARVRARNGDAAGRAELERLTTVSDARVARRASFMLAELDLAAGRKDDARARLDALVTGPEASLGADAATLLARSYGSAAERAEVWRRYLATYPTSPYYERGLLERADALLDAGRTADAKKILDEVRRSSRLTEAQQRQLDRLTVKAR